MVNRLIHCFSKDNGYPCQAIKFFKVSMRLLIFRKNFLVKFEGTACIVDLPAANG